ncbi:hypothetical protein BD289DRAFT_425122 [Coniella lustricola]|uniref:Uncharacterized protein n=1 Tax=Coniella lustricola TaxID=2025994 RepID=A0A2T3AHJ3_9PEZI|nr:hypothetical protein BD289DRAFT_425122 [Coniella lustricola]
MFPVNSPSHRVYLETTHTNLLQAFQPSFLESVFLPSSPVFLFVLDAPSHSEKRPQTAAVVCARSRAAGSLQKV